MFNRTRLREGQNSTVAENKTSAVIDKAKIWTLEIQILLRTLLYLPLSAASGEGASHLPPGLHIPSV